MTTGVWLVGCRGSVAVTGIVGALAIRAGLADRTGCVTELPPLTGAPLPALAELTFGGHDVTSVPLVKKAQALADAGVLPAEPVRVLEEELAAVEREVRPLPSARDQAGTAALMAADLAAFRERHRLRRVVVVNVATTEPAPEPHPAHADLDALEKALRESRPGGDREQGPGGGRAVLPPSSLAAYAAFRAGCPFVDFTPSTGARLPALHQLAVRQGVPYGGHDGKTGETLVKSVLAPMFAMRNLRVRTWSGTNLLGGGDGANLARPGPNAAKTASKGKVLRETLGYVPQGETRIDYLEDAGDFKTAWDLVTFEGFLGRRMRLDFTWHGCDSALAAPLVLDLARLTAAAHEHGRSGPLTELAFFFKDPLEPAPHALADQWRSLCDFAEGLRTGPGPTAGGPR
jgi:myo-inositol-1-phosphate synthase